MVLAVVLVLTIAAVLAGPLAGDRFRWAEFAAALRTVDPWWARRRDGISAGDIRGQGASLAGYDYAAAAGSPAPACAGCDRNWIHICPFVRTSGRSGPTLADRDARKGARNVAIRCLVSGAHLRSAQRRPVIRVRSYRRRLTAGSFAENEGFVFGGRDGRHWRPASAASSFS